jgi:hypothetical protein
MHRPRSAETLDLMAVKEAVARAEGELAVVRVQAENERAAAVRADAERALIRARRRWWRVILKSA